MKVRKIQGKIFATNAEKVWACEFIVNRHPNRKPVVFTATLITIPEDPVDPGTAMGWIFMHQGILSVNVDDQRLTTAQMRSLTAFMTELEAEYETLVPKVLAIKD